VVEQLIRNQQAIGSNPIAGSSAPGLFVDLHLTASPTESIPRGRARRRICAGSASRFIAG
jgi:hypothetical protein